MEKENIIMLKANFILEIGFKTKNMVKVNIFIKMELDIRDNFQTTKSMVKVE
jgi:hypothetical protein